MATRKIKDAKDLSTQELIYFKGHAKATFMSDGATVEDAVRAVENATYKNKGYFPTLAELQSAFPEGSAGSRAYVGSTYPYSIYLWQNGAWVDSGATGGDESVDLASYYTKSETDTKLTELSGDVGTFNYERGLIDFNGNELDSASYLRSDYIACKQGDLLESYAYRVKLYDSNKTYIREDLSDKSGLEKSAYIIPSGCSYIRVVVPSDCPNKGLLTINGSNPLYDIPKQVSENRIIAQSQQSILYEGVVLKYGGKAYYDIPLSFNLVKGMIITDIGIANAVFLKPKEGDRYIDVYKEMLPYTIEKEIVAFQSDTTEAGEMRVEGMLFGFENQKPDIALTLAKNELSELSEISSSISYSKPSAITDVWFEVGAVKGEEFTLNGMGFSYGARLIAKDTNGVISIISDWLYGLPYSFKADNDYTQIGVRLSANNSADTITLSLNKNIASRLAKIEDRLSKDAEIIIPKPQLAYVNLITPKMPTSKTDDIQAEMEFDDRQGNVFRKKLIINAQGTSSLGLPKKNISIDVMDENYDDSHTIKFGDWVAQDGFHLKSYMLDGMRVKAMAAYDFYESMLLTRSETRNRVWKRLQLPSSIPATSNNIADTYLQIDNGAKNHPSGFPCILSVNGEFYGIYCWQLKKHRDNYHQKKDNAGHIHLDGNISNTLLWEANGVINWNKWAGKEMESDAIQNNDGIEVRNPKKLILVDGSEYDADTNAGELISDASANYNPSNKDMVRTASVRANIESLSRRVYSLTQMSKGAEKKAAIAEVFDVDSIIDFIIFGQITGNDDGYKKNWQWVTYDGLKWAVNAYDLDGVWGWSSWNYYPPFSTWIHNDTPPITLVIENYLDEIKSRYKELRDKGVIDLAKIMQPLVNYIKIIGIDNYDLEFERWTDGARDNLWRFESWMKESIRLTDILMDYNS